MHLVNFSLHGSRTQSFFERLVSLRLVWKHKPSDSDLDPSSSSHPPQLYICGLCNVLGNRDSALSALRASLCPLARVCSSPTMSKKGLYLQRVLGSLMGHLIQPHRCHKLGKPNHGLVQGTLQGGTQDCSSALGELCEAPYLLVTDSPFAPSLLLHHVGPLVSLMRMA